MAKDISKAVCTLMVLAALGVLVQAAEEPPGSLVAESTAVGDHQSLAGGEGVLHPRRADGVVPEIQVPPTVLMETEDGEEGFGKDIGDWAVAQKGNKQDFTHLPSSVYAKRDVARRDYDGKEVTREFCGGAKYYEEKRCSEEYQQSMVMTGGPFLVMALLSLLMWLCVFIARNCCLCFGSGLFGGRYPTKGWCYGELRDAEQGYSECERKTFFTMVTLIFLLVVVGVIVGFTGNSEVSSGMHALIDITVAIPTKMHAIVSPLQSEVSVLQTLAGAVNPYMDADMWASIKHGLAEVGKGASNMQKQVDTSIKEVRKVEDERSSYLYAGLWIPLVLSIMGMLGYYCPVLLTIFVVPAVSIITIVLWIAIAMHVPVAVATADFCVGMNYGLQHPNASSPLDMLIGCHGESGATKMTETSKYFQRTAAHVACDTLNKTMCNAKTVSYPDKHGAIKHFDPVTCPQIQCSAATLGEFVEKTVVRDFQWGCAKLEGGNIVTKECSFNDKATAQNACLKKFGNTDVMPCLQGSASPYREVSLTQCNKTCYHEDVKKHSFTVIGNRELGVRFEKVHNGIKPLSDCSFVRAEAALFEHKLCWDVVEGSDYVMAGLTVIATAFCIGNFVYLGAYKRFHRKYLGDLWAHERERILYGSEVDHGNTQQPLLSQPRDPTNQV